MKEQLPKSHPLCEHTYYKIHVYSMILNKLKNASLFYPSNFGIKINKFINNITMQTMSNVVVIKISDKNQYLHIF